MGDYLSSTLVLSPAFSAKHSDALSLTVLAQTCLSAALAGRTGSSLELRPDDGHCYSGLKGDSTVLLYWLAGSGVTMIKSAAKPTKDKPGSLT